MDTMTFALACPYCGEHTFTICPSILTGVIPDAIKHLVFRNVQCTHCKATFGEAVMTDQTRNSSQRALYLAANAAQPAMAQI